LNKSRLEEKKTRAEINFNAGEPQRISGRVVENKREKPNDPGFATQLGQTLVSKNVK
jgi:hypothetical protein